MLSTWTEISRLFYRIYDVQGAKQTTCFKGSLSDEGNLIKVQISLPNSNLSVQSFSVSQKFKKSDFRFKQSKNQRNRISPSLVCKAPFQTWESLLWPLQSVFFGFKLGISVNFEKKVVIKIKLIKHWKTKAFSSIFF